MVESWQLSLPECLPILLENIQLDPYFSDFFDWTLEKNIPVIVLSLGIVPIIQVLLTHLLGEEKANKIEIVGDMAVGKPPINNLNVKGGWTIQYHDDSGYGHDKSLTIRPYAEAIAKLPKSQQPTLLYAGDGMSDLSAARETDLLFAKRGKDLVTFCQREGVPFTLFDDWSDIMAKTKEIYEKPEEIPTRCSEYLSRSLGGQGWSNETFRDRRSYSDANGNIETSQMEPTWIDFGGAVTKGRV
jgi:2-hydroxy-3-keto-5-methylthiopentenyl-1-phosphate phosphatase